MKRKNEFNVDAPRSLSLIEDNIHLININLMMLVNCYIFSNIDRIFNINEIYLMFWSSSRHHTILRSISRNDKSQRKSFI